MPAGDQQFLILCGPSTDQGSPGLALVVAALLFTLPMALWMRFRGMAWRPTLEMSVATLGVAVLVVALSGFGLVSQSERTSGLAEGLLRALVRGHDRGHDFPASLVHRTHRPPDGHHAQ